MFIMDQLGVKDSLVVAFDPSRKALGSKPDVYRHP